MPRPDLKPALAALHQQYVAQNGLESFTVLLADLYDLMLATPIDDGGYADETGHKPTQAAELVQATLATFLANHPRP